MLVRIVLAGSGPDGSFLLSVTCMVNLLNQSFAETLAQISM
jgi:hypothetical protein